jgi:tripartite ATP-independent transporter DctP family solute receptor
MHERMLRMVRMTLALMAVALVCPERAAAAPTVLKMGWTTSDGPTDPYAIAAREIRKALEEEAPGQFDVQFFPNRQLGDEKEMLEALSFGTMQMGVITNAPIGSIEPAFQVNDLPFLYASEASAHAALDGPLGQELLKKLQKKNIIGLGFAEGGFRQMINNVRPIVDPQNVAGIKWRVMQNPVYLGMFRSLGGNAVPMAWGETFTAVQQKTVDGLEIPLAVIQNNGYFEVTRYLSLTNHTYSALGVLMSKKTWDKLSPKQREAVQRATKKGILRQREANAANEAKTLAVLQEKGMKVNKISDAPAFRSKVTPVYEEFKSAIGADIYGQAMKAAR